MTRTETTTERTWKVGELARATGLTVRALHYYDEIGLLPASARGQASHRRYTGADVRRLYRICELRRLGLGLDEIGSAIDDPDWGPRAAIDRHLRQVQGRLELTLQLRQRLSTLARAMDDDRRPSTEQFITALEGMTMAENAPRKRVIGLVYQDLEQAYDYLVGVFGLGAGQLTRDDEGAVVHAEVDAGDGVIWLHRVAPEFGLDSPRALGAATAGVSVFVQDVDAHCRGVRNAGGPILYEPQDMPYGVREYSTRDPEGGFWSFMTALD